MAHILIADTPEGGEHLTRILGKEHELCLVLDMTDAVVALETLPFDLIIVGVHFDESRMFELLRKTRNVPMNADKPVICFCSRDTEMTRVMHDSLALTTEAFGAWMYLDQHSFNVTQDPDAELRRLINRCLMQNHRKRSHVERQAIELQREAIHELRSKLLAEDWSLQLEDRLGDLRRKLASVLLELSNLHISTLSQQENIASSRELKDRISNRAMKEETKFERSEREQCISEAQQSGKEQQLTQEEEEKGKEGRAKFIANEDQTGLHLSDSQQNP